MTDEMYEDLLERNKLQISELNTLTEEQDRHIVELEKENAELTKAKELIKDFILMAKVEHLKDRYETVDEAEQFLINIERYENGK